MNAVVEELKKTLGDCARTDTETLRAHRADSWMLAELKDFESREEPVPLAVVKATTTAEVATCLEICGRHRTPVVPFGGGSGVCGGVEATGEEVVLSTRGLKGLVSINSPDLVATFGAGTLGIDAENRVREEGLTIGHWPQSVEISTVGGWVATRAAGQYSTAYGNVEDIVLGLEVVLAGGGIVKTRPTPRASAGPDLRQFFMGSEGTLGVVTQVTFSLRPLPEAERRAAFHFPDFGTGIEAVRQVMRAGWRPPVVRLYDPPESGRHFGEASPADRSMLVLIFEGPTAAVEVEVQEVDKLCRRAGGEEADVSVVDRWFKDRNHVPTFRSFLERGVVVDTIEVASTWSRVSDLYDRVTAALREVPEILVATAHSSHSYRSGTNLYFSFAARPDDPARLEAVYRECWDRVMRVTDACGAGIAHHHGIGRVRRAYLESELGREGVDVLRRVKTALDPDALLNPGNLLPDGDA